MFSAGVHPTHVPHQPAKSENTPKRSRPRPHLWQEEELDHPWFRVNELKDVLRQAIAHRRSVVHLPAD